MEALPALVDNALTDPDPHVRWRSLWALGRYDDPSPTTARALAPVLLSPVARDRREAVLVLGELGGREALVFPGRRPPRPAPWRALASRGDPAALAPLRRLLKSEPAQIVVQLAERAVARLGGIGTAACSQLTPRNRLL